MGVRLLRHHLCLWPAQAPAYAKTDHVGRERFSGREEGLDVGREAVIGQSQLRGEVPSADTPADTAV